MYLDNTKPFWDRVMERKFTALWLRIMSLLVEQLSSMVQLSSGLAPMLEVVL